MSAPDFKLVTSGGTWGDGKCSKCGKQTVALFGSRKPLCTECALNEAESLDSLYAAVDAARRDMLFAVDPDYDTDQDAELRKAALNHRGQP